LKDQYHKLFHDFKPQIKNKKVGLFCNQASFDFTEGKYLFQMLAGYSQSVTVLVPEHGLFAEQQDQVPLEDLKAYQRLDNTAQYVSLYINTRDKVDRISDSLHELDTLIIDIQDIGVRYYTFLPTIAEIFKEVIKRSLQLSIVVIDRPNPAGRQIEGILLKEEFSSLIGHPGIPHRYGLTLGELCKYLRFQKSGVFPLGIIEKEGDEMPVNPSPNIPNRNTCMIFSGQCLLEGTNLSEGRGTTRPFEIFGAPFLSDLSGEWVDAWNKENAQAVLRPLLFVPTFHKYKDQMCYGFQLHPRKKIHVLLYSLKMIRSLKQNIGSMRWLEGPYEAGSDKPAIELLAGDDDILSYLNGAANEDTILDKMSEQEHKWIELTKPFLLYDEPLFQIS
jgi:uncharacterized protein YbbC (DUF1343 family)